MLILDIVEENVEEKEEEVFVESGLGDAS